MTKAGQARRHSRSNGLASAISGAAFSLIVVGVTSLTPYRPPDWVVIGAFWLMLIGIAVAVVPGIAALRGPGCIWGVAGLVLAAASLAGLIILQFVGRGIVAAVGWRARRRRRLNPPRDLSLCRHGAYGQGLEAEWGLSPRSEGRLRRSVRWIQGRRAGISVLPGFRWRYCPWHSLARCSSGMGC